VKVLKAGRSRPGAVVLRDDENYRLCDMDVYGFLRWRDRRAGLFSHLLMIGPGRLPDSYPFTINNNHSIMPSDAHVILRVCRGGAVAFASPMPGIGTGGGRGRGRTGLAAMSRTAGHRANCKIANSRAGTERASAEMFVRTEPREDRPAGIPWTRRGDEADRAFPWRVGSVPRPSARKRARGLPNADSRRGRPLRPHASGNPTRGRPAFALTHVAADRRGLRQTRPNVCLAVSARFFVLYLLRLPPRVHVGSAY